MFAVTPFTHIADTFAFGCNADWAIRSYSITHNFQLQPGGTITPQVTAVCYDHALVVEPNPACSEGIVNPVTQLPGYDVLRPDFFVWNSQSFILNNGVNASFNTISVPPAGQTLTTFQAHTAGACASSATANSEFQVNPFGPGTAVTAMTRCYGTSNPVGANSGAASVSAAGIYVRGGDLLSGTIQWLPEVFDILGSGTSGSLELTRSRLYDPIGYLVEDVNTQEQLARGTLLSINTELGPQPTEGGLIFLGEGTITIKAPESYAKVEIDRTSPNVTPQGYLRVEVTAGFVSSVTASGVYAGVGPAIGTPSPASFAVPEIEFDYDLGTFPGHTVEVTLLASGGGQSGLDLSTIWDLGGGNYDFQNFTEAAAYFNSATIVGPQIVNVYPNTYNEQVTFGHVAGSSDMNTITFKKALEEARTNPVIQWNGADVVTFDDADYYVWDGIDVARTSTGVGSAIVFKNDADFNTVRNCALTTPTSGSESRGVYVMDATGPTATNDNNTFEQLSISGFHDGVRFGSTLGAASSQLDNTVQNCSISACARGVSMGFQKRAIVSGNDISVSHPNILETYAVKVGQLNVDDTVRVHGNNIHDLSGSVAYGIYAATFQPNSMVWIYNNMISQWNGGVCQSIVVRQHARAGVHFNSLYMNESPTATSYYGIGGGETANITISNNILSSDAVSDPVYAIAMGSAVTFTTDHNCFYGTGAQYYVGAFLVIYQTLTDWQATGRDLNSIFAFPGYVSASDLHIDGFYTACDALAVSIADISTDIDGQVRDPLTPDIGADEFQGLPGPVDDLVINRIGTTNDIQLTWSPLPGAMSYKIYRHTDPSTLAPIPAHFIGSTTTGSYVDVGVLAPPDQKCFYVIKASTLP
ncbi:hypothetical protein IT157_09155 [bacterium]|nr:hypothetical protein [bacterium]